jgi:Leucine-rich repeat (LRR) protein
VSALPTTDAVDKEDLVYKLDGLPVEIHREVASFLPDSALVKFMLGNKDLNTSLKPIKDERIFICNLGPSNNRRELWNHLETAQEENRRVSIKLTQATDKSLSEWMKMVELKRYLDLIKYLDLSNNKIRDLKCLARAMIEQEVEQSQESSFKEVSLLNTLPLHLLYLNLSHTEVNDVSPLAYAPQLSHLNLSHTKVWKVGSLATAPHLSYLNLSHTEVADVNELVDAPQLSYLDVSHTEVDGVNELAGAPQLSYLDVSHTEVDAVNELAGAPQLSYLDVSHTEVDDLSTLMANKPTLKIIGF